MDRRQFTATIAAIVAAPCFGMQPEPLYGFKRLQQECAARGWKAYVDTEWCSVECHVLILVGAVGSTSIEATSYLSRKRLLECDQLMGNTIDALAEGVVKKIISPQPLAIYG